MLQFVLVKHISMLHKTVDVAVLTTEGHNLCGKFGLLIIDPLLWQIEEVPTLLLSLFVCESPGKVRKASELALAFPV